MATGFNFQPYVQPYVAPPIEDFAYMGEVLNERYESNLANMTELELLANQIQVLPTSQEVKDKMLADVNATLSGLRERGDYENAAPIVREAARRMALDPNLNQAAENFKLAQQYDEEIRQARLQGRNMIQFRDYRNEEYIDGRLQRISSDNQQQLEYRDRYESYFDGLQPESISISESGWSQGPGGIYQQTGRAEQRAGIAVERIQNIVNNNLDSVISSTNEGIQRFRVLTELDGLSADEAREVIRGEMMGAGLERVFQSTSTSTSASPLEPVGIQREAIQLSNEKARRELAASQGQMSMADYLEEYNTEFRRLEGGNDLSNYFNDIGQGGEKGAASEAALSRQLSEIAKGKGKAAEQAKKMQKFIGDTKKLFPDNYADVLAGLEATKGKMSNEHQRLNALYRVPGVRDMFLSDNPSDKRKAEEFVRNYMSVDEDTRSKQFLFLGEQSPFNQGPLFNAATGNRFTRTPLEEALKDGTRDYEISLVRPNALTMPSNMRASWNDWSKDHNATEYDLVNGDEKNFKGKLNVVGISHGRYGIEEGQVVELEDKEGNRFIAKPKSKARINNIAGFVGRPDIQILNEATRNPEALKMALDSYESFGPQANEQIQLVATALLQALGRNTDDEQIQKLLSSDGKTAFNIQELKRIIDTYNRSYE